LSGYGLLIYLLYPECVIKRSLYPLYTGRTQEMSNRITQNRAISRQKGKAKN
jgi:hypothetical protein